ncbi:rhamnulokinase [Spirillospora sp. CA-253888]
MTATIAAIDLGATSGRVITARLGGGGLDFTEVHRFPNRPVTRDGALRWDIRGLYGEILTGLRAAGPVDSVGIDSWAVDYGLLDASGELLADPVHYRDPRTAAGVERTHALVRPEDLYAVNGLQFLPFNTLYQLGNEPLLARAETLLLIPDLITYWLTGHRAAERTNASTTGLYDPRSGRWSDALIEDLGLPRRVFPDLTSPGDPAGVLSAGTGLGGVPLTTVASHDTASAIAAVPAETANFAYISCGTWSLAGVEVDEPILTEAGRSANFTNETGADGTIRYLRNVMGMWLLSESLRAWGAEDQLHGLLAAAADLPPLRSVVDPNDPAFMPPGDMPARIAAACAATGQPVPGTRPQLVRCILDSLALGHREAVRQAASLSGKTVDVVHLVGGGSRNALLCRLTADATGLPVIAGPAEATALGNIGLQARRFGMGHDLGGLRRLIARSQPLRRYEPSLSGRWDEAAERLHPASDAGTVPARVTT